MKNLRYIALFLVSFYATGCVIKREISFNSDYSGSIAYTVDYSGIKTMASMGSQTDSGPGGSPTLPLGSMDSLTDLLKNPAC